MVRTSLTPQIKEAATVKSSVAILEKLITADLPFQTFKINDKSGILKLKSRSGGIKGEYCGTFDTNNKVVLINSRLNSSCKMAFKLESGRVVLIPFDHNNLKQLFIAQYQENIEALPVRIKSFENSDAFFGLGKIKSRFVGKTYDTYEVQLGRVKVLDGDVTYRYMLPLTADKSYGFVVTDLEMVLPQINKGYNLPKDKTIYTNDIVEHIKTKQLFTVQSSHSVNYVNKEGVTGSNKLYYCLDDEGVIVKLSAKDIKKIS